MEGTKNESGENIVSDQTMAWIRKIRAKETGIPNLQFENTYDGVRHPFGLPDFLNSSWHPLPTMLNLRFSHAGEWIKVPKEQGDSTGPDYSSYHIGRLEKYLDTAGITRKAIAYGKDADSMKTWFSFDEVRNALGAWVIPQIPYGIIPRSGITD